MDSEALPQRAASSRRSRTNDTRPLKLSKGSSRDFQDIVSDNVMQSDIPEYRSNAEENQQFECQLTHSRSPSTNASELPNVAVLQILTTLLMFSCMLVSRYLVASHLLLNCNCAATCDAISRGFKSFRSIG